ATRAAMDKHALTGGKLTILDQRLPGCKRRDGSGSRLDVPYRVRHEGYLLRAGEAVFRLCALPVPIVHAVNLLSHVKTSDPCPQRGDQAGELVPQDDREGALDACLTFPRGAPG